MPEVIQAAAATAAAPPVAITARQGADMLAERRKEANPISDAARTMGQRTAEARKERQAQATQTHESPAGEGDDVKDDSALANDEGETLNETADNGSPSETEAGAEGESEEAQTIDLGEGVTVTVDEIRDGLMLKADHTKKTQALAERNKQIDTVWTQKLAKLDNVTSALEQKIGKPKSLKELITEFGRDEALERYAEQEEDGSRLIAASRLRDRQHAEFMAKKEAARDEQLAETYNKEWADPKKRDVAFTALSAYALKLGADPEHVSQLVEPWMIQVLDKASKYDALQSSKGKITKHVADKPLVTRPGAKVSAQANAFSAVQTAQAKAKTSGSLADAVALLRAKRGVR